MNNAGALAAQVAERARDHFFSQVSIAESGCWEWEGWVHKKYGYGDFYADARTYKAHRWSYVFYNGPIPEGLVLDHLCRNRRCVNPVHLEPVTLAENVLRGMGEPAQRARQTHCLRGHLLEGWNLVPQAKHRKCRICAYARRKAKND